MTNIVKTSVLPNAPKKIVSRIVDKSRFMKRAHAIARTYEGDYIACLALAMRKMYLSVGGPQLVATYKPTFSKMDIIVEDTLSYQLDDNTWHHDVMDLEPTLLQLREPVRSDRYNRARALSNGIEHLKYEYDAIFKEMSEMINLANAGGIKSNIARLKANNLALEAEKLIRDIRLGETFTPKSVHCEMPKRKRVDQIARNFTDKLMGTYHELVNRYPDDVR